MSFATNKPPPLTNCIHCRGNPKRTYSRHYVCSQCMKEVRKGEPKKLSQSDEIPF